ADPGQTLSFSLDLGAPATAAIDPVTGVFTWTPPDGPLVAKITIRVTDNAAAQQSDTETILVSVNNVAPVLSIQGAGSVTERSTSPLNLSATDPGSDLIHHWTIFWGDGASVFVTGNPTSLAHVYADNGSYTIRATASDEDTSAAVAVDDVTVINVPPAI